MDTKRLRTLCKQYKSFRRLQRREATLILWGEEMSPVETSLATVNMSPFQETTQDPCVGVDSTNTGAEKSTNNGSGTADPLVASVDNRGPPMDLARTNLPSVDNRYCTDHVLVDRVPTIDLGRTDPPSVDNSHCTDHVLVDRDPTMDLGRTVPPGVDNSHCTDHVLVDRVDLGRTNPPSVDNSYCTDHVLIDRDPTMVLSRTDPPSVDNSHHVLVDRDPTMDLGRMCG